MKFKDLVFLLAGLISACLPLSAQLEFSGYFENRLFLIENREIPWNAFNDKFFLGDYNRLRLLMKTSAGERFTVNLAVDLFSFHGAVTSPLGVGSNPSLEDEVSIIPDRLFADIRFKGFDVSIGRQRIPLGVSYLWAPLDVLGRVNVFEPKEEKPGVNAVKVFVPLGASTSLTGVFSPDADFSSSTSALRGQIRLGTLDAALTVIHDGKDLSTTWGFDLRGENLIGWWIEAALSRGGMKPVDKLVLGFDATLPITRQGLYWLNELYYDSSGKIERQGYDFDDLSDGRRFTLARAYLFSMLRLNAGEFVSASLSCIANFNDGSLLVTPGGLFEISQNISLSGGFYLPFGAGDSEFGRIKMNFFYLWLKINF